MLETICQWKNSSGAFKDFMNKVYLQIIYLIYTYKEDLALNNLQQMICHKTNQTKSYVFNIYIYIRRIWY